MKVYEIMQLLETQGTWVHRSLRTRDHLLFGDQNQDVHRIGVCWVATKQVLQEAMEKQIDLIISHENPFYQCSTQMYTAAMLAAEEKKQLLRTYGISVYRCHDVWDCIREFGVVDQWAKRLGFAFEPRKQSDYYVAANIPEMSLGELAQHTADVLQQDHEGGAYTFGDPKKQIHRIVIGTGAITNLYEMLEYQPDALIVSDDGIHTFDVAQYALDQSLGMVVVNHSACERAGLKAMVPWLQERIQGVDVSYLEDGFAIHYYTNDLK